MTRFSFISVIIVLGMLLVMGMFGWKNSVATVITPTPNPYPTSTVPRQGVAPYYGSDRSYLSQLGSWVALWSPYNGTYTTAFQIIPMLTWAQELPLTATVQSIAAKTGHNYWLVFNECENAFQCRKAPTDQAQFYHDHVLPLIQAGDPNAKLIIGGTSAHECGVSWLTNFVLAYRSLYGQDPPRAGWHFHIYPDVIPSNWQPGDQCPNIWAGAAADRANITYYIEDAERVRRWWSLYGMPSDEIWITETGCLVPQYCPDTTVHPDMVAYIAAITAYLNNQGRWINRYAWYTDQDPKYDKTGLVANITSGELTAIGTYYSQVKPSSHVLGFQYLTFLPVVLNNYGAGNQAMARYSSFVSPLSLPSQPTFNSPLSLPTCP